MKASRGKSAMGGGSKSKKSSSKRPHEIHIKHGKSGGFIVRHTHKPDPDSGVMPEDEEHVLPDQASLLQHVADNTDTQAAPQAPPPDMSGAGTAPGGPAVAGAPPTGM